MHERIPINFNWLLTIVMHANILLLCLKHSMLGTITTSLGKSSKVLMTMGYVKASKLQQLKHKHLCSMQIRSYASSSMGCSYNV